MPPADLRVRVSCITDETQFGSSGWQSAADFRRALAGVSRSIPQANRILEWGCGCGRILRELPVEFDRQELHGCDIDAEAIAWLQENMPLVRTLRSEALPPLPYPNDNFDLILNHSVLTHLDERYQDAWLAELSRVLDPEGVLILTVHGPWAYEKWIENLPQDSSETKLIIERSKASLDAKGIYFHIDDGWSSYFPSYYQSTFHTPWYIFERWTEIFDILSYIPRGSLAHQDMIVLRHKRYT